MKLRVEYKKTCKLHETPAWEFGFSDYDLTGEGSLLMIFKCQARSLENASKHFADHLTAIYKVKVVRFDILVKSSTKEPIGVGHFTLSK